MTEIAEFLYFIVCGAGVGIIVGLTGVGGGSLMTPLLIFSGIPTKVAIGTDLLYAAATKSGALYAHYRQQTVNWGIVARLCLGSIPASILTSALIKHYANQNSDYSLHLEFALGLMLVLTSLVVLFKSRIRKESSSTTSVSWFAQRSASITVLAGVALGVFVTLSSVGAGAFCAALLLTLFPRMPAMNVVGTDIAHAVPLTLVAGLGHLWNNNIDWLLLLGLLVGSLPAVQLGAKLSAKIPNIVLQRGLALLLMGIGARFLLV